METNEKQEIWRRAMGTSWHGNEFLSTIEEIKKVFGEPDIVGHWHDKVQYEWILDLEISNSLGTSAVITIYDWKEYRDYHEDVAQIEIENVLNLFRND